MHCTRLIRGGFIAALLTLAGTIAAQAATVTLNVVNAADNSPVATYKYIINVDNTGTNEQRSAQAGTGCNYEDDGYPLSCNWASIHGWPTSSPIYTQGDQSDFASGLADVPDGRYLISVLAAGYKLDGRHFRIDGGVVTWDGVDATNPAGVVRLRQPPLPDGQIQAAVFDDIVDRQRHARPHRKRHGGIPWAYQRHPGRGHHQRVRRPVVLPVRRSGRIDPRERRTVREQVLCRQRQRRCRNGRSHRCGRTLPD